MNFDMAMFHQTFFEEAADLLSDIEGLLLRLEESPDDKELLNTIFRCAHSIKGGSATFGFADVAHFTHGLETLLDKLRNGEIHVDSGLVRLLLESFDQLRALMAVVRDDADTAPDSEPFIARIEAAIAASNAPSGAAPAAVTKPEVVALVEGEDFGFFNPLRQFHLKIAPGLDVLRQGSDPIVLLKRLAEVAEVLSIECDIAALPMLAELDPESCCLCWNIQLRTDLEPDAIHDVFEFIADESEITLTPSSQEAAGAEIEAAVPETLTNSAVRTEESSVVAEAAPPVVLSLAVNTAGSAAKAVVAANPAKADTHTLRVSTDKVDKLINLVGELVINQSMLNEVIQDFSMAKLPRLIEAVGEMERASRELQERVMAVRMLPIKHAFGRFPRLVHDLSASCGKKIELKTSGEETELDKTVIEAIADPLTHLVRNSIDHGMETPEERKAAGKSEMGSVALHAFHEGGNIVIEISDDGRGLNKEKILRKAIERGLISEGEMPPDDAIHSLIFHPGFSTADKVTDLSGRGVGMDIVKQAVQGLGGSINLTSTPGKGTRFRIRLPLTMAILEGLSLSVGKEVYIMPLTSIVESIRPKVGDVRKLAGMAEVVMVRGEVLPILRLYQIFGADPYFTDPTQALLVIVENDGRKVALLVDELIGQSQVVIKSLESNYRKVEGIAGATILGDGRVALILDVPGLIRGSAQSAMAWAA